MVTVRVNRSHPINRLRGEFDRLFEQAVEGFPRVGRSPWLAPTFPAVNVWEDEENVYAEAELPGVKLDDIELFVVGDQLTIKGERRVVNDDDVSYLRKERGTGSFARELSLPVAVDSGQVEATLRDGVLTVTLPKAEEAKPRKVEVKALPK
jgi:HSP20 family protein